MTLLTDRQTDATKCIISLLCKATRSIITLDQMWECSLTDRQEMELPTALAPQETGNFSVGNLPTVKHIWWMELRHFWLILPAGLNVRCGTEQFDDHWYYTSKTIVGSSYKPTCPDSLQLTMKTHKYVGKCKKMALEYEIGVKDKYPCASLFLTLSELNPKHIKYSLLIPKTVWDYFL